MKCSLCGYQFEEGESAMACKGCPFFKGCEMARCPNCGFEMPVESKMVRVLKEWGRDKIGSE